MKYVAVQKEVRSCRECPYFSHEKMGEKKFEHLFRCRCSKLNKTVENVRMHRHEEGDVVLWMFLERIYWADCPLPDKEETIG